MDEQERPRISPGDVAHAIAKAGISSLPLIGAPASELFALIVSPPLEKRRVEWISHIGEDLKLLSETVDGLKLEQLSQNETFITTATYASQAAIRNHQKEKLEALRAAILNAALPKAPSEDMQLVFVSYIDALTTWHLRLLQFFNDPVDWGKKHKVTFGPYYMGSPSAVVEEAFVELKGQRQIYDLFVKDLFARGLMGTESLHTTMTAQGMLASRTTDIGKQFLAFITSPLREDSS